MEGILEPKGVCLIWEASIIDHTFLRYIDKLHPHSLPSFIFARKLFSDCFHKYFDGNKNGAHHFISELHQSLLLFLVVFSPLLKNVTLLLCYPLLKPEASNFIFLYDQPGEHIVTAI